MRVGDTGINRAAHLKEVQLESKTKKIQSEEELLKARSDTTKSHALFSDQMFADVGGFMVGNLGRLGVSSITSNGAGAFSGSSSSATPSAFGSNIEVEPASAKKKNKHFLVDEARASLEDYLTDQHKVLMDSGNVLKTKCLEAMELAKTAADGSGLEGLGRWRDLLLRKVEWLDIIMHEGFLPVTERFAQFVGCYGRPIAYFLL